MSYRRYSDLGEKKRVESLQPNYQVPEIQSFEHKQDLIRRHPFLCVDVYANWCQPCKQTAPEYGVMAKQYAGKIHLVKEDLQLGLSKDYGITAVPTFLIFHRGALVEQVLGADMAELRTKLDAVLESTPRPNNMGMSQIPSNPQNPNQLVYDPTRGRPPPHNGPSHARHGPPGAPGRGFNVDNRHRY